MKKNRNKAHNKCPNISIRTPGLQSEDTEFNLLMWSQEKMKYDWLFEYFVVGIYSTWKVLYTGKGLITCMNRYRIRVVCKKAMCVRTAQQNDHTSYTDKHDKQFLISNALLDQVTFATQNVLEGVWHDWQNA